jgi:hypothetical protein
MNKTIKFAYEVFLVYGCRLFQKGSSQWVKGHTSKRATYKDEWSIKYLSSVGGYSNCQHDTWKLIGRYGVFK